MNRRGTRFRNHLDDQLVRLHKNLYISPADPLYHEKVIRYLDPRSPEAHYCLGQKHELNGNYSKAIFHYMEVLRIYPSDYYSAANKSLKELEERLKEQKKEAPVKETTKQALLHPLLKGILVSLLLVNLVLISLFFFAKPISSVVTSWMPWGVGKQVTYETVDVPYQMYFNRMAAQETVEKDIYRKAIELSKANPEHNVLIYGLIAASPSSEGKTALLTSEELKEKAFVIAEYYPVTDQTVKIRFLNANLQKQYPLTAIGANMVRTAIASYMMNHGSAPKSLNDLLQDYPANYISFVPIEPISNSNEVHAAYDGSGGWVYEGEASTLAAMFYPNVEQMRTVPYEPYQVLIDKERHKLQLISGEYLLREKRVGLGAGNRTPIGSFTITDRVLEPQGSKKNMYGTAGLGMGTLAIHGTWDESSIGVNLSLGCIRLTNADMEDLFAFVPKGTAVLILEGGDENIPARFVIANEPERLIPGQRPLMDETTEGVTFYWLG